MTEREKRVNPTTPNPTAKKKKKKKKKKKRTAHGHQLLGGADLFLLVDPKLVKADAAAKGNAPASTHNEDRHGGRRGRG